MRKTLVSFVALFVLMVSLIPFAPTASAAGPATWKITDLTTGTVLTNAGTDTDRFNFVNGHRYKMLWGNSGWSYERMYQQLSGGTSVWTNITYTTYETASGSPCTTTTDSTQAFVDCNAAPTEQGDVIQGVEIDATLNISTQTFNRTRVVATGIAHPLINTSWFWKTNF